jgi:hypothetical protein
MAAYLLKLFYFAPGLSLYPEVKIAAKNATITKSISVSPMFM